jgi:hypothetical protein
MGRKTERITLYEPQPDGQGGMVKTERAVFEVEAAGGTDVLDVFQILCRTLFPALKSIAPLLARFLQDELATKKTAGAGASVVRGAIARQLLGKVMDIAAAQATIEGVLDVATEFMTRATRQDWHDVRDKLLLSGTTHVTRGKGQERVRDMVDLAVYDEFFSADLPGQLQLIAAALRVNYGNFFGALGGLLPAPAEGAAQTSATSATSPGPSTVS